MVSSTVVLRNVSIRNFAKARKFIIGNKFNGMPKMQDIKLVEEPLPGQLSQGEILCKTEWASVDPYMRAYTSFMKVGDMLPGSQIARVVASSHGDFPEGTQVLGRFGWRDLTVVKVPEEEKNRHFDTLYKMPDLQGLPDSYALGSCGMPGITALLGLQEILAPKKGQVLVVSSAAGAVGSLVCQLGKHYGCKVVAFSGSEDKISWLKKDLGLDLVFNYKTCNVHQTLKEVSAPTGVHLYWDNVGGEFTFNVMRNMAMSGKIAVCGAVSQYNHKGEGGGPPLVPLDYFSMIYKQIRMEGFMVMRWIGPAWIKGTNDLVQLIKSGQLNVQETTVQGFENMPKAFIDLLEGKNTGKMVVKC